MESLEVRPTDPSERRKQQPLTSKVEVEGVLGNNLVDGDALQLHVLDELVEVVVEPPARAVRGVEGRVGRQRRGGVRPRPR